MTVSIIFLLVLLWIVPPFVAHDLMKKKGRSAGAGVGLGLLLGWVGVLIAACLSVDPVGLAQSSAATREP